MSVASRCATAPTAAIGRAGQRVSGIGEDPAGGDVLQSRAARIPEPSQRIDGPPRVPNSRVLPTQFVCGWFLCGCLMESPPFVSCNRPNRLASRCAMLSAAPRQASSIVAALWVTATGC